MDLGYTLILLVLAAGCWAGSRYFEKRQNRLARQHCVPVSASVCGYVPLEGADRKGRPVFATCLEYQLDGKEYQVQLDDQVAEADQQPLGTAVQLLCSREDPTQCMLAECPKRKGWFL